MTGSTLAVHVERYVDTKHNQETRTWYAKYLRPMVDFLGPDRSLDSITRTDGERYWRAVQARKTCWNDHPTKPTERRPLSSTTLHNHLRAARTFWNEMVRQRLTEVNPVDHLKAPRDTRPVEMKAISAEDLRAIWRAAMDSGKRDFAMITLMATTGIRAGELVSMALTHLDLKQGMAWGERQARVAQGLPGQSQRAGDPGLLAGTRTRQI
ncbi:MAG: site-specific integrase [Caldilinea sp.]|jgi:site-specific recombinase XerC